MKKSHSLTKLDDKAFPWDKDKQQDLEALCRERVMQGSIVGSQSRGTLGGQQVLVRKHAGPRENSSCN